MKKIFVLVLLASFAMGACSKKEVQETEVNEVSDASPSGFFGEEITADGVTSLTDLVAVLETDNEFTGKVMGEIKDVCAMKGCWMTIDLPNGETMRVTFKDYGFFVPKNSQGYPVIIEGVATKKITDVATLKHYAEDAGKSQEEIDAITSPKLEYAFEALGVIIKENV